MGKRGPKPLSLEEKARRGTLRPCRVQSQEVKPKRKRARRDGVLAMPSRTDYGRMLAKYMADVAGGAIVTCALVRLAVERQLRDLQKSKSDRDWPYVWSQKEADKACAFIERLPH